MAEKRVTNIVSGNTDNGGDGDDERVAGLIEQLKQRSVELEEANR